MTDLSLPLPPDAAGEGFCLRTVRRQDFEGTNVLSLPADAHGLTLVGITRGTADLTAESLSLSLPSGAAVLLSCNASLLSQGACTVLTAVWSGREVERLLMPTCEEKRCLFPRGADMMAQHLLPLFAAADNGFPLHWQEASAAGYALLMSLYGTQSQVCDQPYPPLTREALSILREEFAYLYGIDELAERLSVSKEHLIRQFSSAVGISPGRYLTALRIDHAKLCLRSGETSLEAIAASAGFSGAGYFGRVFRQYTGMTPLTYAQTAPRMREQVSGALYL